MIEIKANKGEQDVNLVGDEVDILAEITNVLGYILSYIANSSEFEMDEKGIQELMFPMFKFSFEKQNRELKETPI